MISTSSNGNFVHTARDVKLDVRWASNVKLMTSKDVWMLVAAVDERKKSLYATVSRLTAREYEKQKSQLGTV
jgi:hypothetical protein